MFDPMFLEMIVCPQTGGPLREADAACVARVNAAIAAGTAVNRAGRRVVEPIEAGLLPPAEDFLYPVRDEILTLLIDEAIALPTAAAAGESNGQSARE